MSAKILIFACRGVCAFTLAKREEKSAFLFNFLVVRRRGSVGTNIVSWVHHIFLPFLFCFYFFLIFHICSNKGAWGLGGGMLQQNWPKIQSMGTIETVTRPSRLYYCS